MQSHWSITVVRFFFPAIAASHPHLFQWSITNESEIHKLVANYFLLDRVVLQWRLVTGEDIPTPNTNEIVVFSSFFQCRFGLPAYDFLRGLLDHFWIELVHLNPNSILEIVIFIHLCKAFLGIPPNFPLFKNYFFLRCQSSVADHKVIGVWVFESAFRPLVDFGVLNDNLIKGLILCVKCLSRF
jgi:hypothetical protein